MEDEHHGDFFSLKTTQNLAFCSFEKYIFITHVHMVVYHMCIKFKDYIHYGERYTKKKLS